MQQNFEKKLCPLQQAKKAVVDIKGPIKDSSEYFHTHTHTPLPLFHSQPNAPYTFII
jgi:hypothetical protein